MDDKSAHAHKTFSTIVNSTLFMKKKADIYPMVSPDHVCPWWTKALALLRRNGFKVKEHHLNPA